MIHKYSMNSLNIVLDIHSGSVHIVDDVTFRILDYYKENDLAEIKNILKNNFTQDEIEESYNEIKILVNDEVLFSEDIYEEYAQTIDNRNPIIKAMCLHVTHDCNLKCKYCFAEEGEYQSGKRSLMSFETGKKALDFLIKSSGTRKNLEVDFFGGEPLMNFDVVKKLVEYGREEEKKHNKNFRFTITTNGVLLNDEIEKYINEHMHNIVLSIDGREEINNLMRPNYSGKGTYDKIVPKFQSIADKRNQTDYYVRGTFTKHNLDFGEDVLHLADLGFKQVSVEPVVADVNLDYAICEDDVQTIYDEYERLAVKISERKKEDKDFNFFHFMIDLSGGPCVAKRLVGCGAGTEYVAITPSGEIYPCHQFVGNTDFEIGNLDEGIKREDLVSQFTKLNVYTKDECKNCWAKFYCSGGCLSNAYNFSNDLTKPYEIGCKLQRKRVECAIMIKVAEALDSMETEEE